MATQTTLFEYPRKVDKGADFSRCRKFRFALWRIWDKTKPLVMFVGLNPSTANEDTDDPTIRRVRGFAEKWGYGGFYMMNCFAYISTNPDDLKEVTQFKKLNDHFLEFIAEQCSLIVFAWGSFEIAKERSLELKKMFPQAKALVINKDGSPRHPLYVKGDVQLVDY